MSHQYYYHLYIDVYNMDNIIFSLPKRNYLYRYKFFTILISLLKPVLISLGI